MDRSEKIALGAFIATGIIGATIIALALIYPESALDISTYIFK
jgi:hypothetical protein